LQARLEQLSAYAQRQHTANHEHGKAEQQVQSTNVFVVGGIHPTTPARRRVTVVVMGVIVMV
jgi:metallophosphoesterase superfamily enzyme